MHRYQDTCQEALYCPQRQYRGPHREVCRLGELLTEIGRHLSDGVTSEIDSNQEIPISDTPSTLMGKREGEGSVSLQNNVCVPVCHIIFSIMDYSFGMSSVMPSMNYFSRVLFRQRQNVNRQCHMVTCFRRTYTYILSYVNPVISGVLDFKTVFLYLDRLARSYQHLVVIAVLNSVKKSAIFYC